MLDRSNEIFDPFIVAERGRSYKGTISLSQLGRLSDCLFDDRGTAQYELSFAKEDGVYTVAGWVQADLFLECSVCLDRMVYAVKAETRLGIVSSLDEAALLPEVYEPLLVIDRKLTLKEIVEEELLLAVPIIPRHEVCRITDHIDQRPIEKAKNPFSILADLKLSGEQ